MSFHSISCYLIRLYWSLFNFPFILSPLFIKKLILIQSCPALSLSGFFTFHYKMNTFWAATGAPTKLGMRWWTGRGLLAKLRASIMSHILFRITHFQAFGSAASAMARRASASSASRSASYAAASKGWLFLCVLAASTLKHRRGCVEKEKVQREGALKGLVVSINGCDKRKASILLPNVSVWFETMLCSGYKCTYQKKKKLKYDEKKPTIIFS